MTKAFDPAHAAANGYTLEDWDEVDSPELTDEQLAQAKPFAEVFPDLHASIVRKRGPERTKTPVTIRLDDDVVNALRATGPGWQTRVNDVLKDWLAKAG